MERPEQQNASINARYQPMSYELTGQAGRALRDRGVPSQMWEGPNGPYLHRFMTACLTASIELAVRKAGFRYLSQADIFGHAKCPQDLSERDHPLALPHRDGDIIPDQLFGIDYNGRYRFFALEADRKTETIVSSKALAKAFAKKLEAYAHILEHQAYRKAWGIPTLTVLTVTTSETHMKTMMVVLEKLADPRIASGFLFKAKPEFGKYWIVPPVMTDLLTDPWQRVAAPLNIGKP